MTRTKLKDRILPQYTKGEEIFNMTSHIVGGAFGIIALVLCVIFSAIHSNGYAIVSSIIYGISMIILYNVKHISWFKTRSKSKESISDIRPLFYISIDSWFIYAILFSII